MNGRSVGQKDGFRELRETAAWLNRELARAGLVSLTFGNASVTDLTAGVMAIKPSGIACDDVTADQLVLVDVESGAELGESLRPSSDTRTHLVLVRALSSATAVIHTHSPSASSWAQAKRAIPCLGTTHADYFSGAVPITRDLTADEIASDYTGHTGDAITELYGPPDGLDPVSIPAVLVASHGVFAWGSDARTALESAVTVELVAAMASATLGLRPDVPPLDQALLDHHHERKHGPAATYGQRRG